MKTHHVEVRPEPLAVDIAGVSGVCRLYGDCEYVCGGVTDEWYRTTCTYVGG